VTLKTCKPSQTGPEKLQVKKAFPAPKILSEFPSVACHPARGRILRPKSVLNLAGFFRGKELPEGLFSA